MISMYWDGPTIGEVSVLKGYGANRLSIESNSAIVHIAGNSRYEWEGLGDKYINFIGYEAGSSLGKTIRFSTDNFNSVTPLAIKPLNEVDALHFLDNDNNVVSHFNSKGWLGINTESINAPLHISTNSTDAMSKITLFENADKMEVFTVYNSGKSSFLGKSYYSQAPLFSESDSLALVSKQYVDGLQQEKELNILINPSSVMNAYTIVLPLSPKNGMECNFYFGGIIESGVVVKSLLIDNNNSLLLPYPLPQNIEAGEVLTFKWFSESGKWYRKN
jgi:hypothetical protein